MFRFESLPQVASKPIISPLLTGARALAKKYRNPLSIAGALTVADAATQATVDRKPDESVGVAALRGAKSGAVYGSVLGAAEPFIKAKLKALSSSVRETRFSNPKSKTQNPKSHQLLRGAAIGAGAVAGGVAGLKLAPRLLKKGSLLKAGENTAGAVVYTEGGRGTPLGLMSHKGRNLRHRLEKHVSKTGSLPGKAALKVDDMLGVPTRHYGIGVGGGRVLERTHGSSGKAVRDSDFGRGHPVHVDSRPLNINDPKQLAGAEKRASEVMGKKKGIGLGDNCEHSARYIAGQGRVSKQTRALVGGLAGGAVAGGAAVAAATRRKETKFSALTKAGILAGGVGLGGLTGATYGSLIGSIAASGDIKKVQDRLANEKGVDSRDYVTKRGYRFVGSQADVRPGDFGPISGHFAKHTIQQAATGKNAFAHQPKKGLGMVIAGKRAPEDVLAHEIGHLKDMKKNGNIRRWEYSPIGSATGHQYRREEAAWKESGFEPDQNALNSYRKLRTGSRIGAGLGVAAGGLLAHAITRKMSARERLTSFEFLRPHVEKEPRNVSVGSAFYRDPNELKPSQVKHLPPVAQKRALSHGLIYTGPAPTDQVSQSIGFPDAKALRTAQIRHETVHAIQSKKRGGAPARLRDLVGAEIGAYRTQDRRMKGGSKLLRNVNKVEGFKRSFDHYLAHNPEMRARFDLRKGQLKTGAKIAGAAAAVGGAALLAKKALQPKPKAKEKPSSTDMSSSIPLIEFDLIERATAPIQNKKQRETWKDVAQTVAPVASVGLSGYLGHQLLKRADKAHEELTSVRKQIGGTTNAINATTQKVGDVADSWEKNNVSKNIADAGRSVKKVATAFTPKKKQVLQKAKVLKKAKIGLLTKGAGGTSLVKKAGLLKRLSYAARMFHDARPPSSFTLPLSSFPLTEFRNLTRSERDQRDVGHAAAAGAAGGTVIGAVAGARHLPGRPPGEKENNAGKRYVRRTKWPLVQHEGIGIGAGKIAEVHHSGLRDKNAHLHAIPQKDWSKGKPTHVIDEVVDISAAQRARAASKPGLDGKPKPFKYKLGGNNCQTFTETMKTGKKPMFSRQFRQAAKGAAKGAGLGALALGGGLLAARKIERAKNDSHLAKGSKFQSKTQNPKSKIHTFAVDAQGRNVSDWDHLTGAKQAYNKTWDAKGRPRVDTSSPADVDILGAAKSIHGKAKTVARWSDRGTGLVKDTAAHLQGKPREKDAFGRQKKREWEKPWFGRHVKEIATTGALIGAGLAYRKSPFIKSQVDSGVGAVRGAMTRGAENLGLTKAAVKKPAAPVVQMPPPPTAPMKKRKPRSKASPTTLSAMNHAITIFAQTLPSSFCLPPSSFAFDANASDAGWDVRDPRGRSARVFAPGSRPRDRREKKWHEKTANERLLWGTALAGTAALAGVGTHVLTKNYIKSHPEKLGLVMPKVSVPKKQTGLPKHTRSRAKSSYAPFEVVRESNKVAL